MCHTDHVEVRPKENFLGLILSFHLLTHLIDPALSSASFLFVSLNHTMA